MGRQYVSALPREHLVKAWRLQSDCAMLDMEGEPPDARLRMAGTRILRRNARAGEGDQGGAWIIRFGSGSTGMSPTMTGEHGPQPGGSAWILARAASLSKGARALLAGARDIWTILKG